MENVGEINDLVIDAREREIRYVAVTYGGVLGIGNEMHAVPFEAFKFKADPDDQADTVLVLNVTQAQMKGAKGFDESDNSTKTPFDQNENQKDIDITANICKRLVDSEMSVKAAETVGK